MTGYLAREPEFARYSAVFGAPRTLIRAGGPPCNEKPGADLPP